MSLIRISTRFNRSGIRVLKTPLSENYVIAPAKRIFKATLERIDSEFRSNMDSSRISCIESISCAIAEYISNNSTTVEKRYSLSKCLAESFYRERIHIFTIGHYDDTEKLLMDQLKFIPSLYSAVKQACDKYITEGGKAFAEHETAREQALSDYSSNKDALWREISGFTK